jgi:anaerobic selenocysteine-containing dehydrogenase
MASTLKHTVCRVCHAQCALTIEMDGGQPGAIHGDKHNPAFHGYSCVKGRQFAAYHSAPTRLLQSQKRQPDGSHAPISTTQLTREISDKVADLIARHGPRSVALYIGTHGYTNAASFAFSNAFIEALDSPMLFTSVTIDQPGKGIAMSMHGLWLAGTPPMADWDVLTLIGTNPVVSMNGGLGVNPARHLHEAKKRGMKLVVIDPRRTECAEKADVHLAVKPGEDPAVLAAIAHVLIADNLYDAAFVTVETTGFAKLRQAVAAFTPEFAGARADVDPADIVRAARIIGQARHGAFSAGTGSNMAGRGNLVEYFVKTLTTLKGFWKRAGDVVGNPGVIVNPFPAIAASPGPTPVTFGQTMRVRGLQETAAGLPTAALSDEILLEGDGQIKALFVMGGNPMLAWPDQIKATAAMDKLELLVCFDPHMSATARRAHYVVAPKMPLEVYSCTAASEIFGNFGPGWGYEQPYAQWADPVLEPPAPDMPEEWQVLHGIAGQLGKTLRIKPCTILDPAEAAKVATPVAPDAKLDTLDVWQMLLKNAPVPMEALRAATQGKIFARPETIVAPRPEGWTGRLDIGAAPMMEELQDIAQGTGAETPEFPLRVISRRTHDVLNSCWHENPVQRRRAKTNSAYMNPADMERLQLASDDIVQITSARAAIQAVVATAPDVRPGCISMSHAWGGPPDEADDPFGLGGNTGRLASDEVGYDRYTGIPLMSAIPVRVAKIFA